MKKSFFGIALLASIAACSTQPVQEKVQADAGVMAKTFPVGSGTWHYADQTWDNGIHFCTYMSGRNKVISRIETFESCPSQVDAPTKVML